VLVVGELNVGLILAGDATPAFGQAEKLVDDATLTLSSSWGIFACGSLSTRAAGGATAQATLAEALAVILSKSQGFCLWGV
jgi:hypothetical protein